MQTAARRLAFSSSSVYSASSSPSERVFIGLLRSDVKAWRKLYGTSVAPIMCKSQRGKRMPIEERRALVESFVDKYKARNEGRLPCTSHVQKEIGGSFYVIRQILQELQYNTTLASLSKGTELLRKAEDTVQNSSAKELPSISVGDEIDTVQNSDAKGLSTISTGDEIYTVQDSDTKGLPSITSSSYNVPCGEAVQHKGDGKALESGEHQHPLDYQSSEQGETIDYRKEIAPADSPHDAPCGEVVQHKGDDKALKSLERQHPIDYQSSEQGDSPKAANLWSTLRSFADGIIGFWRKK